MKSPKADAFFSVAEESLFIFDGDCGICTSSVELLRHVVLAKLTFVPYQLAPLSELGLTSDDCSRAAQVVTGTGVHKEGYDAFHFAFSSSPLLSARVIAGFMSWNLVRFIGLFVYDRVAQARHSGIIGGEKGACKLPHSFATVEPTDRNEAWLKLKSAPLEIPGSVVDTITREREETLVSWGKFTKQVLLVSSVWALGAMLLAMRLLYGSIIGYGWGWQMFS